MIASPIAMASIAAQVSAGLPQVGQALGLLAWIFSASLFAITVVPSPLHEFWLSRLPPSYVGEPMETRSSAARLQRSTERANDLLAELEDHPKGHRRIRERARKLAAAARHEAGRPNLWSRAWAGHAAWLSALVDGAEGNTTDSDLARINDLSQAANELMQHAVERARHSDPDEGTPPRS